MHIFQKNTAESSAKIKRKFIEIYGPIAKNPTGKPIFIKNPEMGISIAHDGELTIGAVADTQIGIDIVCLPLEVEFNQQELSWLFQPPPEIVNVPYYWAAREAFIKCTGAAEARYLQAIDNADPTYDPNSPLEIEHNHFTCPDIPQLGTPLVVMNTFEVYLFKLRNYIGAVVLEHSTQEKVKRVLESFM